MPRIWRRKFGIPRDSVHPSDLNALLDRIEQDSLRIVQWQVRKSVSDRLSIWVKRSDNSTATLDLLHDFGRNLGPELVERRP